MDRWLMLTDVYLRARADLHRTCASCTVSGQRTWLTCLEIFPAVEALTILLSPLLTFSCDHNWQTSMCLAFPNPLALAMATAVMPSLFRVTSPQA
eukprot:9222203-Pyramimonas_sp.AAC.1